MAARIVRSRDRRHAPARQPVVRFVTMAPVALLLAALIPVLRLVPVIVLACVVLLPVFCGRGRCRHRA